MKFLVDAQLPPVLAHWLRETGHEAQAVREIALRDADDSAIWQYATANACVIITKDEDFAQRVQSSANGPCVVWLRVGNSSNTALRTWFIPRVPEVVTMLTQGSRLVEIL